MRRTATTLLTWLLPLLALAAALPLRTPLLFKHRYPLLLAICLLATAYAAAALRRHRLPRWFPDHLASCSRAVATDLLRTRWGHRGLLIIDDFTMLPVWHAPGGLAAAVVRALNAGVDLILISADTQQVYPALAALLEADRAGALDAATLARSRARLARQGPGLADALFQR